MKRLIMFLLTIGFATSMSGQNTSDALRYSRIFYSGTARFQGLGGAFGALGADFSVLQTNPGGIGLFRSSEFSMGPTVMTSGTESEYYGMTGSDSRTRAGLGNMGVVFSIPTGSKSAIKNINFGFGVNRESNFNNRMYIRGANNQSSILTDWSDLLQTSYAGFPTPAQIRQDYPFDVGLAYDANLIYDAGGYYTSDVENGGVIQTKSVKTGGSINEFDISAGGNYNDVVYFGATIGIPMLRYFEDSYYTETNNDVAIQHFQSMDYSQHLETFGTGFNFKAGVVVRPANFLRIGAAVHTPTWFGNMRDSWNSYISSQFYDSTAWNSLIYSPEGHYDYQMVTPFRAIGSLAFLFGKVGLISAEYEYVNYGSTRFYTRGSEPENTYQTLNDDTKSSFVAPVNVRVGTEWAIDVFRIRGGFGYYGSPYGSGDIGSKIAISGGAGYRSKHFFADVSYVWSRLKDNYYLYSPVFTDPVKTNTYGNTFTATFGVRF